MIVHTARSLQLKEFDNMVDSIAEWVTHQNVAAWLAPACGTCKNSPHVVDATVLENAELKEQVRLLRVEVGKLKVPGLLNSVWLLTSNVQAQLPAAGCVSVHAGSDAAVGAGEAGAVDACCMPK